MSKDPIGTLVRNESLRKVLSVLLTVAMVLQGFSYRGLTTAYAEEALPEEYVVNDEGSDDQQVEVVLDSGTDGEGQEVTLTATADEQETAAPQGEDGSSEEGEQLAVEQDGQAVPETEEVVPEAAVPAVSSLSITNKTTESQLASSARENHLIFEVGYAGLDPEAGYEVTLELMDRRTPEAVEAKTVLLGEPDEDNDNHQEPFAWSSNLLPENADGILTVDLENVDLHWVAGASYPVRVTINDADGALVVQKTFDAEDDAKLYVPGIASKLSAADGSKGIAAAADASLVDVITVKGLPEKTETAEPEFYVIGALATSEGTAVATETVALKSDEYGVATGQIAYPAFDASDMGEKTLISALPITTTTENGDVTIVQYPNADESKYEKEADATEVKVAAKAESEENKEEAAAKEDAEEAAKVESGEGESSASVSTGENDIVGVNVQGTATEDTVEAIKLLTPEVGAVKALSLAVRLKQVSDATPLVALSDRGTSNSPTLDEMSADVTSDTASMDGNSINSLSVSWISKDGVDDGDESLLTPASSSDAMQLATAQIDYSLSGEHDYAPGEFRVYVPAVLFNTRDGNQAGGVVIPYPEAPSTTDAFNWQLFGDYYVVTNTAEMKAASTGFIQFQWVNLRPHEIVDEAETASWYAYLEVDTNAGNKMAAVSNQIKARMDTNVLTDAAYKRVATDYPKVVPASELPSSMIPAAYADEASFVIVDWYTYAHYKGNHPFTLDMVDELLSSTDGVYENGSLVEAIEKPGFIYKVSTTGTGVTRPEDGSKVDVTAAYSGWPGRDNYNTSYIHIYSAYPVSQFEADTEYIFHNQITYTLNGKDGADDPTTATAKQAVSYKWLPADEWPPNGEFRVTKWGNDGAGDLTDYEEKDMVSHNYKRETNTISREGSYLSYYPAWYGLYDDVLNQLKDGKEPTLWYTIHTVGFMLPYTLMAPTDNTGLNPDSDVEYGWWQWAKLDESTGKYVVTEEVGSDWAEHATYDAKNKSYSVDTSATDGYTLVPYTRIESNYLKRPVTLVTSDLGLNFEGASNDNNESVDGGLKMVAGEDYVFDYVEVDKPYIGTTTTNDPDAIVPAPDKQSDNPVNYVLDDSDSNIPPVVIDAEVNGEWQESYAIVDWSSGSPVTSYANGDREEGDVVTLPEGTTDIRSSVTSRNSFIIYYIYPGVRLLPNGVSNLRELAEGKFTDSEGNKVYKAVSRMWNGSHLDVYQYDEETGKTMVDEPIFTMDHWGDDRINDYSTDTSVYPSKEGKFNHVVDVDYEKRTATVHYTIKIVERTHVPDRETYEKALADGIIVPETSGTFYDLIPEGMIVDRDSIKLRSGDAITNIHYDVSEDWRGTGRNMLIVEAELTPTPAAYKENPNDATSYWADVPTLTFDATMDLDTWIDLGGDPAEAEVGIVSHNVVAFESGTANSDKETFEGYSWEYDGIDQANARNVATKSGTFSDDEVAAFENLDPDNTDPSFVYAECETRVAFPSSAIAALSKSVRVNDETNWSKGTYSDERDVWEGGKYSYRLRTLNDSNTKSKNIVLYDSLENYYAVEGNDEADINAPRWQGSFSSVDLSQVTYDAHACRFDVTITDNGDGTLKVEQTPVAAGRDIFTNRVMKPAQGEVKVQKTPTGRDWKTTDEFTFTITADKNNPDANAVPKDADGNAVTEVSAKDATAVSFGTISFGRAGSYRYTVREAAGDYKHVTYDTDAHVVTITVVDDGSGQLVAKEGSSLTPTVAIENEYTPDTPEFELKIKDTNDSTDEESDWQDSADYDEGDTVPFKIDVTLPDDVTEYDEYDLTIEDVMDESLDFDEVTSVQLIDPETGEVIREVPATVTPDPDGHGFKVEIEWGDPDNPITEDLNDAIVRVNFEATLNEPVTGNPGNMDAARITYSDDPSDPTSTKTSGWDNVITYSYKVEVSKVDDKGKALEGAEFELVKVKASDTSQEVAKVTAEVNGATFTFKGIDDGTYVLRETKAPKGYQKAADVTFVVAADHEALLDSWLSEEPFAVDGRTDALTSLTGTASDGSVSFTATAKDGKLACKVVNKPDTPTTPEKPKKPKQKLVKTSDLASPFLPQLTMLGSALLSAGVVLSRRKRRNK